MANLADEKLAVAKTAPALVGATVYDLTLQDWVAIATFVYIALQVGLLVPKYSRLIFGGRKKGQTDGARGDTRS